MSAFERAFCASLDDLRRQGGTSHETALTAELAATLAAARKQAEGAWPGLQVASERFAAQLARSVGAEGEVVAALGALRVAELYFVTACGEGQSTALAEFERTFVPELRAALSRMRLPPAVVDETLQVIRDELFVPRAGAEPKILGYAGRGHLGGWLRAVASRTALRVARQAHVTTGRGQTEVPETGGDLELEYLKRTYGPAFETAFRAAFHELPPRDRLLLKQRLRHRMGVDELGALHGVDPSTASRWVTAARERLVDATRERMMRSLNVGRAEVSSILRLIQSQVDISLTGWPEGGSAATPVRDAS
jgi:RNA polymerase sigma-70 factor, ECF subfamily